MYKSRKWEVHDELGIIHVEYNLKPRTVQEERNVVHPADEAVLSQAHNLVLLGEPGTELAQ